MEKDKKLYSVKATGIGKASIKDVDLSKRIVTGFYNAYNFIDDGMDCLMWGCAKNTIKESGPESNAVAKIKHALFHDITRLPGKIMVLDERTVSTEKYGEVSGIYFETQMDKSTEGTDTLIKYQEEVYDNHSIGYSEIKSSIVERDGQHGNSQQWQRYMEMMINPEKAEERGYFYAVKEIKLYEGSTVGFGMNELTPYLGVKGKKEVTQLQLMERFSKLQKILTLGTLSDEAIQSAEIQIIQLKQVMNDLFEKFEIKTKKETEKQICPDCGADVTADENNCCPDCGAEMKSNIVLSNEDFYSKIAQSLTS